MMLPEQHIRAATQASHCDREEGKAHTSNLRRTPVATMALGRIRQLRRPSAPHAIPLKCPCELIGAEQCEERRIVLGPEWRAWPLVGRVSHARRYRRSINGVSTLD